MRSDLLYRALRTFLVFLSGVLVLACGENAPIEPDPKPDPPPVDPPAPQPTVLELYNEGKAFFASGNDEDYKRAFDLFRESADKGCDSAQVATAFMFEYGLGTGQDIQQATEYYRKAANQSNWIAKDKIRSLGPSGSKLVFPEGYSYPLYKLHVWSADTLRSVNGNCTFLASSNTVLITDENENPVYISLRSANEDAQISAPATIDAKETAVSMLLLSIPFVFNVEDDNYFQVAKEAVGELPETDLLARAIDASIVRNGHFEVEDVRQELAAGANRIMTLLRRSDQTSSHSPRQGSVLSGMPANRRTHMNPAPTRASSSVNKPEIVFNENIEGAVWAEIPGNHPVYNSAKDRDEWKVTLYNSLPMYFALVPGHISGEYVYSDPLTAATEFIVKPSNITEIYKDIGLKGPKDFFKNQWVFWTEDLGYLLETLQTGNYEEYRGLKCNQTSGSAMIPIDSDDDMLIVQSVDTNAPLLGYCIADIIIVPLLKQFLKSQKNKDEIWAAFTKEFMKYFNTKNVNELIVAIGNQDEAKYRKLLMTIVEDFFVEMKDALINATFDLDNNKEALNEIVVILLYENYKGQLSSVLDLDPVLAAIRKIKKGLEWIEVIGNSLLWAYYQLSFPSYAICFSVESDTAPDLLEPIDMGLSVMWANCNVGATSSRGPGRYYAWGETVHKDKDKYDWSTYAWGTINSIHKYNLWSSLGPVDGLSVLEPDDDVATVLWGEKWRTPTKEEFQELVDHCQWTVSSLYPTGFSVKSNSTGKSIFLYPAGSFGKEEDSFEKGMVGDYWTSSVEETSNHAARLHFFTYNENNSYMLSSALRYVGMSVRPVADIARFEPSEPDFDFGTVSAGSQTKHTFLLHNNGVGTMTVSFLPLRGPFKIDKNYNTNYAVPPDGSLPVEVTFAPTQEGGEYYSSVLNMQTNAKMTPNPFIVLNGRKDVSGPPDYTQAVDLGLSVQWASCNVGATTREDYGAYVAWGELKQNAAYIWNNYVHCNGSQTSINKYYPGDGKQELDSVDDIARRMMGGDWRMPTKSEFQELIERCDWSEILTLNGVKGYYVYNKSDHSKYIFLPMGGYKFNQSVSNLGELGLYWTSSLWGQDYHLACSGKLESGSRFINGTSRAYGLCVRAVYPGATSTGGGLDDIPGHNL